MHTYRQNPPSRQIKPKIGRSPGFGSAEPFAKPAPSTLGLVVVKAKIRPRADQVKSRREYAWSLHCAGKRNTEIAVELGLSPSIIAQDLHAMRALRGLS